MAVARLYPAQWRRSRTLVSIELYRQDFLKKNTSKLCSSQDDYEEAGKTDEEVMIHEDIDVQVGKQYAFNQRSAKYHESNTTRAETIVQQVNLKLSEPLNPFGFGSNQVTVTGYQSTKFAFGNLGEGNDLGPAGEEKEPASPTENKGLLARKLKEVMKLATASTGLGGEPSKPESPILAAGRSGAISSLAGRDWNSVNPAHSRRRRLHETERPLAVSSTESRRQPDIQQLPAGA